MSLSVTPINATPSLFLVLILVGGEHVIAEPLELLSYNGSHKEHCIEKPFILIIYPVFYKRNF